MAIRDNIVMLFKRNPGREFTAVQLAARFRVTPGYVGKVIQYTKDRLVIEQRREGNTVYYWTPKDNGHG